MAKEIFKFEVAHIGWESDNWVWVMEDEDEDGKRWLESTNHGQRYKMNESEVREHIEEYHRLIADSQKGLYLLHKVEEE